MKKSGKKSKSARKGGQEVASKTTESPAANAGNASKQCENESIDHSPSTSAQTPPSMHLISSEQLNAIKKILTESVQMLAKEITEKERQSISSDLNAAKAILTGLPTDHSLVHNTKALDRLTEEVQSIKETIQSKLVSKSDQQSSLQCSTEVTAIKVETIDDLPEPLLERVLSYLSLGDLIKLRALSQGWFQRINSFKVKSLCFSEHPRGFMHRKHQLVSGVFAQNFISSSEFKCFFDTFGRSILSNLKQLRLCKLNLNNKENVKSFSRTLSSLGQLEGGLEELGFFGFGGEQDKPAVEFELRLPMLTSLQLEEVYVIRKLTVDAPRLRKVRLLECSYDLKLVITNVQSIERLLIQDLRCTEVKNLKSLKFLYILHCSTIDPTLLFGLKQLKQIHLFHFKDVESIFNQKQRYGRAELKVYLRGYLLNSPGDPAIRYLTSDRNEGDLVQLATNLSRLADEIPFNTHLPYSAIERVNPKLAIKLLRRFTVLNFISAEEPVRDIERFLNLLKNVPNIVMLEFSGHQPQELYDRLPEYCTVQKLYTYEALPDFEFLLRLKDLIVLHVGSINAKLIRKIFEKLPFLTRLEFFYQNQVATIVVTEDLGHEKRFLVMLGFIECRKANVLGLEAVIRFLVENSVNAARTDRMHLMF